MIPAKPSVAVRRATDLVVVARAGECDHADGDFCDAAMSGLRAARPRHIVVDRRELRFHAASAAMPFHIDVRAPHPFTTGEPPRPAPAQ